MPYGATASDGAYVRCPGCEHERWMSRDGIAKIRRGERSGMCWPCAHRASRGLPPLHKTKPVRGDLTREEAGAWARAVWAAWSQEDRRAVREALTSVLDVRR